MCLRADRDVAAALGAPFRMLAEEEAETLAGGDGGLLDRVVEVVNHAYPRPHGSWSAAETLDALAAGAYGRSEAENDARSAGYWVLDPIDGTKVCALVLSSSRMTQIDLGMAVALMRGSRCRASVSTVPCSARARCTSSIAGNNRA